MTLNLAPGDRVKVKLGHDIHETVVFKANKKTVWIKTLFTKTRVVVLTPAGEKTVTEHGEKVIKVPRAKIVEKLEGKESLALTTDTEKDQSPSESTAKRVAIQQGGDMKDRLKAKLAARRGGEVK